jgi:hypothetical protein
LLCCSAPDIQRQLPVEAKAFMSVDKQMKEVMRRCAVVDHPYELCDAYM